MNIFAIAMTTVLGIPIGGIILVFCLIVTQPLVYIPAGIALATYLMWPLFFPQPTEAQRIADAVERELARRNRH